MLHTGDDFTCPVMYETGNYHFERRCEDCDAKYLSRMSLEQVDDRYRVGRITQDEFEAYRYVWALLSPTRSGGSWIDTPEIPAVRRIARKLLRIRGFDVPPEIA